MEPRSSYATAANGRTSMVLSAVQIEFLDRFCARLRRDSGVRFTKALLLRVLVGVLGESPIPFAEIRTETHLREWLSGGCSADARKRAGAAFR